MTLSAVSPAAAPIYMRSSSSDDLRHGPLDIANSTWSGIGTLPQLIPRWYSCTVCPGLRSFQNAAEWKRHEKEHEVLYRCGLCSATESDNDQVVTHQEARVPSKVYTCRRRGLMVDHLSRDHARHDKAQGRSMAESWRVNSGKQAWSCGFCARWFSAFGDRLKHIDNEHFKRHHDIRDWDRSNVILGLLLQPGMKEAWENLVASKSLHNSSALIWENPALDELQLLLEMGPSTGQSAESLALTAYAAARPSPSLIQLATTSFDGASDSNSGYFTTPDHLHGMAIPLSSQTAGFQQPTLNHDPMLDCSDLQDFSTRGNGYAPDPTFGDAGHASFSPSKPNWDPWNDNSNQFSNP